MHPTKWMISPIDYHYSVDFSTFAVCRRYKMKCRLQMQPYFQLAWKIYVQMCWVLCNDNATASQGCSAIILIYCNCVHTVWNVPDLMKFLSTAEPMPTKSIMVVFFCHPIYLSFSRFLRVHAETHTLYGLSHAWLFHSISCLPSHNDLRNAITAIYVVCIRLNINGTHK